MPCAARVLTNVRLLPVLLLMLGVGVSPSAAAPFGQEPGVNPDAAALAEFQKRLDGYLMLRDDLEGKLKPLSTTPDAAELATRQEALAAALRAARRDARQGDLIPPRVARRIAEVVKMDFQVRNPRAKAATLDEVPRARTPAINDTYPADAALPTVPPLLLAKLPPLPDNLQYRFFGRHLVILDGDTEIITDYIADVLPPH